MARLIRTDGDERIVSPKDRRAGFTLPELRALLECDYIEIVGLPGGNLLVIDEEGKMKEGNGVNVPASWMAHVAGAIAFDDCIVGHALLCRDSEVK
ncbi:MAG: hypothetical protein LUD50_01240 [Clostridia bacterium]|nr:hypothetical protein [Clostridia bacterium]